MHAKVGAAQPSLYLWPTVNFILASSRAQRSSA